MDLREKDQIVRKNEREVLFCREEKWKLES